MPETGTFGKGRLDTWDGWNHAEKQSASVRSMRNDSSNLSSIYMYVKMLIFIILYFREWNYCNPPDAIHNGIVHSVGFGEDGAPDREERGDLNRLENTRVIDD